MKISGLGTALITPFKHHKVDWEALANLIEFQITEGIDFLVSMGTTGESATLTAQETHDVVRFTVEQVKGRVPIVVGKGGNDTAKWIEEVQKFDFTGVDAILTASPSYNKPSQNGIIAHFTALNKSTPLPIILYNVPGRTASNLTWQTTAALAQLDNIIGIKEASGDLEQTAMILRNVPKDFAVLSGDDPTAFFHQNLGGHGCISVISNLLPNTFSKVIHYKNDPELARSIHLDFLDIHPWLYVDGNPCGIKAALSAKGRCQNELRLPLVPMEQSNQITLEQIIAPWDR